MERTARAWTPAGWMQDSNFAPDSSEGAISSGVSGDVNMAARWYQPGTGAFTCFWDACALEGYLVVAGAVALAGWASYELSQGSYFSSSGSGTTTGHYSYSRTTALSQPYPGNLSGSLSTQADAMYLGSGSSYLVSTGTGVGTGSYACTYSCRGGTAVTYAQPRVITPPKPPIDENPQQRPAPPAPLPPGPSRSPTSPRAAAGNRATASR
ncbi:hypothetical protein ABT063_32235 [Streptomyces sp. NPDC002838]|uniref:hypothetical protein n=1 Tax=Streptomyces sp. NPDC002838 TaxID=3154436 RepID=UPI003328F37C